jgi:fibronectin type 3 domain-containing protein
VKRFLVPLLALVCLVFCAAYSCGQNGPTAPAVMLTWVQSTSPGVVANCVYRGSAAGTYTLPAIYCSTAPITSYTDTTVARGTSYHYAVTAKNSTTEGGYSNDVLAAVPTAPAAPDLNTPTEALRHDPQGFELRAKVLWIRPQ